MRWIHLSLGRTPHTLGLIWRISPSSGISATQALRLLCGDADKVEDASYWYDLYFDLTHDHP